MFTKIDYENYFGANTAPINFIRLENLSIQLIKSVITSDIPAETDTIYEDFKNAVLEQINYFNKNPDLLDDITSVGSGFAIGKYSQNGTQTKVLPNEPIKRLSPNTYTILLNAGLLYSGLC